MVANGRLATRGCGVLSLAMKWLLITYVPYDRPLTDHDRPLTDRLRTSDGRSSD